MMVARRRGLLGYLQKNDIMRYRAIVDKPVCVTAKRFAPRRLSRANRRFLCCISQSLFYYVPINVKTQFLNSIHPYKD